mgnify:CR=1 FL=1
MTPAKAKVIFATHMQAARSRKLTTYETNQLSKARQVLRQQKKPSMNPRKSKVNSNGVLIYGEVQTIYAKKTQNHRCDDDCKAHGHKYYHKFTSKPKMYGLPDGTLLIKP